MMSEQHEEKTLHGAMAGSGSTLEESILGLIGGALFGLVSPVVGHPLDTIKTKMQADSAHLHSTFSDTVKSVYRSQGVLGFYRGFLPPLLGSIAYRGVLFGAYSGAYAACEHVPVLHEPIFVSWGLRPSVLIGGIAASLARATIESPLDFIKVRSQIGKHAMHDAHSSGHVHHANFRDVARAFASSPIQHVQHLYHGFLPTMFRTMGLVGSFFIMVDYSVRYIPDIINAPLIGPFFKGGICATTAWVFAFPFETAKSVIQSDTTGKYKKMSGATWKVMKQLYRQRGISGLYRGFGPGASRSFLANGASMVVYAWFQDTIRK
jgi:solute carrier family 25 (mitochondrial carnitine/acylcarnitine transporter), member 20/29